MLNLFSRAYTVQSRSFIPRDYLKRYAHKCSSKSKGPPWKILFFGTDPFSLHSLKSLCAKFRTGTLISSLGVVAKKHSAVSKFCAEEKLPLYFWPVNEEEIQSLYDIGMVVSFGNLIPRSTIEALPLGCINVHASLLPRWRGAAPIIHAVMAGDTETGVTIMRIHPDKFDVGEIVRQYRVSIGAHERAIELEKRLSIIGSDLLMECLRDLPKCVQMAVPQPKEGISYAPKVVPSVANVNLKSTSAQSLYNRHRAISHLFNLKVKWHGQVVKLKSISLDTHNKGSYVKHCVDSADSQKSALNFLLGPSKEENESKNVAAFDSEAGSCYYDKASKSLKVICSDGQALVVNTLQIGNKIMSARDFYNGYMSKCEKDKWKFTDIDSTTM